MEVQTREAAKFSIPSIIAIIAAIASFPVGALMGFLLAIVAVIFGAIGFILSLSPRVRGGQLWLLNSGTGELGTVDIASGRVDPIADVQTIQTELILRDLDSVTKRLDKARKMAKGGSATERAAVGLCERLTQHLDVGKPATSFTPDGAVEEEILRELQLLTHKRMFYVANVDEASLAALDANPHLTALRRHATSEVAEVVPICARLEAASSRYTRVGEDLASSRLTAIRRNPLKSRPHEISRRHPRCRSGQANEIRSAQGAAAARRASAAGSRC